ncbi:MAG: hypothetical protein KF860_10815 [Cyclobacteriaceae bacterium]|nr:hypothetical protein [Cyclobacteriaceae bacterium]
MNKSTKIVVIIIGMLSVLAGVYSYLYKEETTIAYFGIFLGIVLIGAASIAQPEEKDK